MGNSTLPSLWGADGIKPTEVATQGRLADNWFLGAAAALAEHPERVKSLFTTTDYPFEGIFESNFYVKGYKTTVIFDDRLAVLTNGKPVNSRQSESSAWWLVLLEKAYAKLNVNYLNLRDSYQQEALRALTGMPVLTLHTDQQSDYYLGATITRWAKQKSVMSAINVKSENGLVKGHSYTIFNVVNLQ